MYSCQSYGLSSETTFNFEFLNSGWGFPLEAENHKGQEIFLFSHGLINSTFRLLDFPTLTG
jgi:hypothetical protein